jgi:hypothetical protein
LPFKCNLQRYTEEALRLLASSAPEWCTLMGADTTVGLCRLNQVDP